MREAGALRSTQEAVFDLVATHAECDPAELSRDDVLADIGVNSLKFIMMMLEIQQLTGRKVFSVDNIGRLKTVGDILRLTQP